VKTLIPKAARIFVCLLSAALMVAEERVKEQDLAPKYKDFLKLTSYIILSQEKNVFMVLQTDRDREVFIDRFWKQRDPTPGTPLNEFKDEMIKRFLYAEKFYGRGTSREGWTTDMGRIHMILGEPTSKHNFHGLRAIHPTEVWYYYGDKAKGLPTYFGLVFFKKKGIGEFKLYSPIADGISSLMVSNEGISADDYQALYERLEELVPTLAPVALSIIPGDIPYMYAPSPGDIILMAGIFESPKKNVNINYATHFLEYKGMVSTEYMSNFVDSAARVDFVQDPLTGLDFLNFSIAPKTISFDYFEPNNQYFCNYQLNVSLRKNNDIVFQYSRDFPIYFSPAEAERIKGNGISIEDSFPVPEGKYKLIILLQNSVGKEFTVYEKEIFLPERGGSPRIVGPIVGYDLKSYSLESFLPYKLLDKKLMVDPAHMFSIKENIHFFFSLSGITEKLWEEGKISLSITGLRPDKPSQKSILINLSSQPFHPIIALTQTLEAAQLSADYYKTAVSLIDGSGQTLDVQNIEFGISANEEVPHPSAQAKMMSMPNKAPFFYMLANQYEKSGRPDKAEALYQKGFEISPHYKKGVIDYVHFLYQAKKYVLSLQLLETLKDDGNLRFDYLLAKGLNYKEMGQCPEAIENLLEGNKIYNSDIRLLNALGACYQTTGQKEKALGVLRASLKLDPTQADIRKIIQDLVKNIN